MSILDIQKDISIKQEASSKSVATKLKPDDIFGSYPKSEYKPDEETRKVRAMVVKHFQLGDITMQKPRVEFNDMSVNTRMMYDQMAFNTYQPNNGDNDTSDLLSSWRANVIKPVIRNKCISILAHITANLIFPKVFAYDQGNNEQKDAATVMSDLMEWTGDKSDYAHISFLRTLTAITDPASIGYTEYVETYRDVKTEKKDGKWQTKKVLDETLSGFQDYVVPCNELFIENPYEPDIQKQGWLIWRKVISYSLAEAKYKDKYPNFEFVFPGVQLIYNDANNAFYQVYDANLRQEEVEEIIYWNRTLDLKLVMVNGVMLTDPDEANPRLDKKYPFDKFYYEMISPKFFYGKSVVSKMQQDGKIISTLYNYVLDGTYLTIMPPMINAGGESITSDVVVPGVVTTLESPTSSITPIKVSESLQVGWQALHEAESSLADSSENPINYGVKQAAYVLSRAEQQAAIAQGPFLKMIAKHVKDFGKLRMSDILQYLTIADVDKLESNGEVVYKTFLLGDKNTSGGTKTRKIQFESSLSPNMSEDKVLKESYKTLSMEDKFKNTELYRVNPETFRTLTFDLMITPDVLSPRSSDLEKAAGLEEYDRMILNPTANPEETFRLLLGLFEATKRDPDKYVAKQETPPSPLGLPTANPAPNAPPVPNVNGKMPAAGNAPMANMAKGLPQTMAMPKM